MIIKIVRYRKKTATIDGQLYIEGMRICDCAENAKSAIKAGQYIISICKCKQHARKMPIIQLSVKVPEGPKVSESSSLEPFETAGGVKPIETKCLHCKHLECVNNNTQMPVKCPMLKPGNGVYHREDGSIIVGEYIAPGCLKHPKEAFDTIYDRIRKNVERGNDVTLIIEEHYPKTASKELSPFEMGTQILAQMGGRKLNL